MKTTEPTEGPAPSNAFLQLLQTHAAGEVCNELADAMRQCVVAVALTGKGASLTLSAQFVPAAKGAFAVTFGIPKIKLPEPERLGSLWYGDEEGNLSRHDPTQKELPLKTVAEPAAAETKKVS